MTEMHCYIGITIGPILKTMNLVSTPAALWASSYLFSYISYTTCCKLVKNGLAHDSIVSPYFDPEQEPAKDGVGRYHDRIIFKCKDESAQSAWVQKIKDMKPAILNEVAGKFAGSTAEATTLAEFLNQYVLLTAVAFTADNAIMGSGKPLDSAEFSSPFMCVEKENPLLKIFGGQKDKGRNELIKTIAKDQLKIDPAKWQLLDGGNIRSLPDIAYTAKAGNAQKRHRYYAVVRADGDGMSNIFLALKEDDKIHEFSKKCLQYCEEISKTVAKHHGMTVYAGGDDLLAILPCSPDGTNTVFDFIKDANQTFYEAVAKDFSEQIKPTLSWGVFICYERFPLYEALSGSARLLFGEAKADGMKNCSAIRLQKHSGETMHFILPNESLEKYLEFQRTMLLDCKPDESMMLAVLYKMESFAALFDSVTGDLQAYKRLCKNIFDGSPKAYESFLYEKLPEFIYHVRKDFPIYHDTKKTAPNTFDVITTVLRFLKFYVEKAGEKL